MQQQMWAEQQLRDKACHTYTLQLGDLAKRLYQENVPEEQRITIPQDASGHFLEMLESSRNSGPASRHRRCVPWGGAAQ
ncbi:hypothetical protein [Streptomyces rochei]|uniref:hypothetical protein n=1 Tax=Streptomyces rochei TaxID=1928 RepID=UPI003642FD81